MGEQAGLYSTNGIEDNSFAAAIAAQAEAEAKSAAEAEAAMVAAEAARREAEEVAAQAAEEARRRAEEAERLQIEAETARRIAEQEAEAVRAAKEAEEEAGRQARAREEARARAIEAERKAQMAEKIAEEYRQKARTARSEAAFTGDPAESAGAAGDGSSSEYTTVSIPGEPGGGAGTRKQSGVTSGRQRIGSKLKNSMEIGFVLLLCAATIAVQAISGTGLFKNRQEKVRVGYEETVVELAEYEDEFEREAPAVAIDVADQTTDQQTDAGVSQTDPASTQTGSTAVPITDRIAALGEVVKVTADLASYDQDATYKGYGIMPVQPVTWEDENFIVSLTGITGADLEPYLTYDVRIKNVDMAKNVKGVGLRNIMLDPDTYLYDLEHYSDEWDYTCTKDAEDPGLYHVIMSASYFTSGGESFVHHVTGVLLEMDGGIVLPYETDMRSVLQIPHEMFTRTPYFYSGTGEIQSERAKYEGLEWYSVHVECLADRTSCSITFGSAPNSDQVLTYGVLREFAGKLKLVVNGTEYSTLPGSTSDIGYFEDGDAYAWVDFPRIDVEQGDEIYMVVDGERMDFYSY